MRDFERDIWAICTDGRTIPWLRQELAEKAPNDKLKKEDLNLVDEELLKLIREPWAEFINSVLDALASDISYEHTYTRIERLGKELEEKAKDNPAIILAMRHDAGKRKSA